LRQKLPVEYFPQNERLKNMLSKFHKQGILGDEEFMEKLCTNQPKRYLSNFNKQPFSM